MTNSEKKDFVGLITDALAFYRREPSKFALSVWWQACQSFEFEQVSKAVTAHAMDPERGQYAPMPADIVRQLHGTHTDRSLIAWGKVMDAVHRVGAYQSVVFDDGAIHAAIEDMGGWVKLCRSGVDELPHVQRRFTETYRAYARRPDIVHPPKLIGAHEAENALSGRRVAAPMLVGNAERARLVMRSGSETARTAITALDALPSVQQIGAAA